MEKECKDIPTLVLYGVDDHFTRHSSELLFELMSINNRDEIVKLQGIPGGHLPHLSSPKLFAASVMAFVENVK